MIGIKKALDKLHQFNVLVDCVGDYEINHCLVEMNLVGDMK